MEKNELLKRVLMMQRLQGMETEPISAEDPYASMEKDQMIGQMMTELQNQKMKVDQELTNEMLNHLVKMKVKQR